MQMVTLNKDDIYQGPLVLVNHNYPIANNYQITNCSTAKDSTISLEKTAMEMLCIERFDLVVLDLNLPDTDGMTVLKELRKTDSDTKVLILSARCEVAG